MNSRQSGKMLTNRHDPKTPNTKHMKRGDMNMRRRRRGPANSPSTRELIIDYLTRRGGPASFDDIYQTVSKSVQLATETPRASIFSILIRSPEIERVDRATYKLRCKGL